MAFSRREFLSLTAGLSAIGFTARLRATSLWAGPPGAFRGCSLLDCGSACTIKESLAGYESALIASGIPYRRISVRQASAVHNLIVPAAHLTDRSVLRQLKACLNSGATLLFESGATFLDQGEFDVHRRLMESEFGLRLCTPRRLWGFPDSLRQAPYISYNWPTTAIVRDFNRLIPVCCERGEIIARFQELPVAVKRQAECGTLVFLGSPLGPHLLAGDREARIWFKAFCSSC